MLKKINVFFLCFLLLLLMGCNKPKYPSGARDICGYWGIDNQYQLYKGEHYSLRNMGKEKDIEPFVSKYIKIGSEVYFIGSRGYTILNYEKDEIKQREDIDCFDEKEKQIFKSEKLKILTENEYTEINIGNLEAQNKFKLKNLAVYLEYYGKDAGVKEYFKKNKENFVKPLVIEWFKNNYEIKKNEYQVSTELLIYLNEKVINESIYKVYVKFDI